MGKDRRSDRRQCLRCENWAIDDSELCADCEQSALNEMEPVKSDGIMMAGDFDRPLPKYWDPFDQIRADSQEGGE